MVDNLERADLREILAAEYERAKQFGLSERLCETDEDEADHQACALRAMAEVERRALASALAQRDEAVAAEREACAKLAAALFPRGSAHTYASENADVYYAQEDTCARIAAAIRARTEGHGGGE